MCLLRWMSQIQMKHAVWNKIDFCVFTVILRLILVQIEIHTHSITIPHIAENQHRYLYIPPLAIAETALYMYIISIINKPQNAIHSNPMQTYKLF